MPDCITAKWAASRLAVSSMHNYAATLAGSWPMPRPTRGSGQSLPRSGAARLARSRSSMPCLRPWRRSGNAQSRVVAEIKVGSRTATVPMSSSPRKGLAGRARVTSVLCAVGNSRAVTIADVSRRCRRAGARWPGRRAA